MFPTEGVELFRKGWQNQGLKYEQLMYNASDKINSPLIDFASRFPPRQLEAEAFRPKMSKIGVGSTKNGFRASDLHPEGLKRGQFDDFSKSR